MPERRARTTTEHEHVAAVRERAQERLLASPDVLAAGTRFERRVRAREAVAAVLQETGDPLGEEDAERLVREIADGIAGLGPLEPLLADPDVTEIMVNGPARVFVERAGEIEPAGVRFRDDDAVLHLIDRIVAPLGLRVDAAVPWADARLVDGSRVHAIVPPLALTGPTVTIRRFPRVLTAEDLVVTGALGPAALETLVAAVAGRRNVVVSGGAGAGKTTLLRVLASFVPPSERIVTIEDVAELRLEREHVVALEARPPNVEGRGAVTIRDLVRNALRMRPDRLVVGEVRGAEAIDMLQAMNTGHAGSMSTAHANSPADLLTRLEAMALMGDTSLSVPAVRRQIAAALDLVVHVERARDGRRVVSEIAEVRPSSRGMTLRALFRAPPGVAATPTVGEAACGA